MLLLTSHLYSHLLIKLIMFNYRTCKKLYLKPKSQFDNQITFLD